MRVVRPKRIIFFKNRNVLILKELYLWLVHLTRFIGSPHMDMLRGATETELVQCLLSALAENDAAVSGTLSSQLEFAIHCSICMYQISVG